MSTGIVWHELYLWHDTGSAAAVIPPGLTVEPLRHAENPETKRRLRSLLEVSGLLEQLTPITPRKASDDDILRFHSAAYVDRIRALSAERGGDAGFFTPFGPGSYDIACLSAGGVIAAVDAVLDGTVENAYALVRPPGHHAEAHQGIGFCIFNNVVIAAQHARQVRGLEKIAIVDWDVHHGNGTQAAFYDDPGVLTVSIHQDSNFPPESGGAEERGAGAGEGYNINIPLPPGSGVGAYVAAFERVVLPALACFRPQLIMVPCGFDAGAMDPLARMMMHSEGYRTLTRMIMEAASETCDGHLVLCHEGGYHPATVPYFGLAVIEQLSGVRTAIEDPFLPLHAGLAGQELQPHQAAAIRHAEDLLKLVG